mgnify:CR=1 FL=1
MADNETILDDIDDVPVFNKSMKKKKKQTTKKTTDNASYGIDNNTTYGIGNNAIGDDNVECNYPYEFLLDRVFGMIQSSHVNQIITPEKQKLTIPAPTVGKDGTKKTVWTNFATISDKMGRSYEHVMKYALAEMGTIGSLDANNQFIIKGRFQTNQLQTILRHYAEEYVVCKTCKSADTVLEKGQNRMYFVICRTCKSQRSVAQINTGFSAQIEKRNQK